MRSKEQIDYQVEMLGKERKNIPEYSKFGDPNWECIDTKIEVLKGLTSPDDIEEYLETDDDEEGDGDYSGEQNPVYEAAVEAHEWLMEDTEGDLFDAMWANKS